MHSALDREGNLITSPEEIADTFADHFANIWADLHKKSKPGKNKEKEELPYSKPYTDRKLKAAIDQQKNTALGEDTIQIQIINRKLPPETLMYMLDLFNKSCAHFFTSP